MSHWPPSDSRASQYFQHSGINQDDGRSPQHAGSYNSSQQQVILGNYGDPSYHGQPRQMPCSGPVDLTYRPAQFDGSTNANYRPSAQTADSYDDQPDFSPGTDQSSERNIEQIGSHAGSQAASHNTSKITPLRNGDYRIGKKTFSRLDSRFFQPGFVFQCMTHQEDTAKDAQTTPSVIDEAATQAGQRIFSKVQMYVVLRDNEDFSSTCFAIQTYGAQGVSKRGLTKSNFAIIYSGDQIPRPLLVEEPVEGEKGMRKPIRVVLLKQKDGLHPKSRIHLRALHCCHQNVKIYPIGTIAEESLDLLIEQHQDVLDGIYPESEPESEPEFEDEVEFQPTPKPIREQGRKLKAKASNEPYRPEKRPKDYGPRGGGYGGQRRNTLL